LETQNNMGALTTIKERWNNETPKFFKGLKRISITLGSSATAVWVVNSSMGLGLDEITLNICKYTIAFCAAVGLTSQLTQVTPPNDNP
jgi:hypothetical protein